MQRRARLLPALVASALALGAPPRTAAQAGSSVAAVDRYLRDEVRRERIPGLSVAVLRNDRLLLARGYGFADVEDRAPATDSTVYQSGSLGKQFTAALVLQLADSGRLRLDDPIRRVLPEGPAAWDSVTIRHLLTHTSGIPDYTDSVVDLRRDYTEDQLVRLAAGLPLQFRPGDRWSYSNTGYVLLGAVIHRVSGEFYGDLLRERVFGPLGMRTARVISEAAIVPHRADGYRLVQGELAHQEWVSPSLNTTADGSLYFTVHDLARWAIGLDTRRVLSAADLAAAWTPVRLNDGGSYPYGFGWMLDRLRGRRRIGHTGSWQGFRTSLQRFPDSGLTVIVLANLEQAKPYAISLAVAGIVEPSLTPPHRLARRLPGPTPPIPTDSLLHRIAEGREGDGATPALSRFLSATERTRWGEVASKGTDWIPLGCEQVAGQRVTLLGAPVARVCYTRAHGADGDRLVTVQYTDDWRAAHLDDYGF
jgi:CubicO group peptidase (beta-lactamase class C family)